MTHSGDGAGRITSSAIAVDVLSEANALFAGSLEPRSILRGLADLIVTKMARWCVVDLFGPEGEIEQVCLRHADPAREALGIALAKRIRSPIAPIAPEIFTDPGVPARVAAAISAEDPAIVDRLGAASALFVPLVARGQALGAITFASDRDAYGPSDLAIAVDLAQRAALAVDAHRNLIAAEEAARIREEFLSIASHELRTPLSALKLQVQSLERQIRRAPDQTEGLASKITVAQRQVERLTRLVSALLDVSRIQVGHLELERELTDLGELVREVVSRHHEEIERSGSPLLVDLASGVVGEWDRIRIDQVVSNLLDNALKYGRARPIHVAVASNGRVAQIVVEDHGIGIAERDLHRIFGRFERAVSSRAYGGMGFGLFVADRILKAHEGTIAVRSELGVGSTFSVELPISSPAARDLPPGSVGPATRSGAP